MNRSATTSPPLWKDAAGTALALVQALPLSMALGVLVFAPMGPEAGFLMGVQAGLVAMVVGGTVALLGGAPLLLSCPRAGGAIVLAGLVAFLVKVEPELSKQAVALAVALCLALSGLLQMLGALLRVDRWLERMPEPVMGGFTLVIGVYILLDQLNPMLLGQYAKRPELLEVPMLLLKAHGLTPWVGLGTLVLMVALFTLPAWWPKGAAPKWAKTASGMAGPLGLVAGTLAVALLSLGHAPQPGGLVPSGVATLGQATHGYSPLQSNWWPAFTQGKGFCSALHELTRLDSLGWLLGPVALLATIHSLDALSTARMLRQSHGAPYQARPELLAQGAANLASGLCGGVGVAAIPALSLALANTGALGGGRRWLYPLWALLALFVLWGLVAMLAVPVLGALVALAGWQMVQNNLGLLGLKRQQSVLAFFSVNRHQAVAWTMLLLAVFSPISVLWLVGIGVALTTALWVHQASGKLVFRQYSGLQRRSLELRSPANRRHLQQVGHRVQVLELEGDLFFGTALLLRERLEAAYPLHPYDGETHHLVLDFSRLDQIDASVTMALESLLQRLNQKCGITVWLSYVRHHPGLSQHLQRSTVGQWVPEDRWVGDTEAALEAIEDELLAAHHPEWQQSVHPQDVLKCPLAAEDWQSFVAACETVALAKGEALYAPGNAAEHVYWLVKGDVRLVLLPLTAQADAHPSTQKADPRLHRAKRLAVLNPGTWLGLDALLPGGTRKATAVAHQPSELMQLDVNVLNGWATTHPALAACLFSNLAAEATERLEAVARELVVVDA